MPTHAKPKTQVARVPGMMTFKGPVLSAMKFGMIRPKIDAAFRILSI